MLLAIAVAIQSVSSTLISSKADPKDWLDKLKATNITEQLAKIHASVQLIVQKLEHRNFIKNPWIFTPQDHMDLWTQEFMNCYEIYKHRV
jgi:hypothetical protein